MTASAFAFSAVAFSFLVLVLGLSNLVIRLLHISKRFISFVVDVQACELLRLDLGLAACGKGTEAD